MKNNQAWQLAMLFLCEGNEWILIIRFKRKMKVLWNMVCALLH